MQKRTLILSLLAVFLALLLGFSAFSTEQTLDNTIPREAERAVQLTFDLINQSVGADQSAIHTTDLDNRNANAYAILLEPIQGKTGLYKVVAEDVEGEPYGWPPDIQTSEGMLVAEFHTTWTIDHANQQRNHAVDLFNQGNGKTVALWGINPETGTQTASNPMIYECRDNIIPEEAEGVTQLTFDKINAPNSGGDTVIITDGYENVTNQYAYVMRLKEIDGKHGLYQVDKACEYWDRNAVFGTTSLELSEREVLIAIHSNPNQQNVTTQFTSETVLSLWGINPQTGTLTASTPMI